MMIKFVKKLLTSAPKYQSKELTAFYSDYKAWVDNGAIETYPYDKSFSRSLGLCGNLHQWTDTKFPIIITKALYSELNAQFKRHPYPFGQDSYHTDKRSGSLHLCPKRLAWVDEHLTPKYTGEIDENQTK